MQKPLFITPSGSLVEANQQVVLSDFSVQFMMDLYENAQFNDQLFIAIVLKNGAASNHAEAGNLLQFIKNMKQMALNS